MNTELRSAIDTTSNDVARAKGAGDIEQAVYAQERLFGMCDALRALGLWAELEYLERQIVKVLCKRSAA